MTPSALMNTYTRQPVAFVKGAGALLWDEQGREYLDALAGVAVCNLGHAHPAVAAALARQAQTLLHTSNIYRIPLQEDLGRRLTALAGMERVFFCNSGAEANEAAIKLARLHGHAMGIAEPLIVVMEGSFHGRTLATLTATGNRKVQAGFEPLVQGFVRAPYGDLAAVEQMAAHTRGIAAVLVEPVQGEGGVNVPPADYLADLRALCDRQGWLLMLDEVQTGMGRTGAWFAHHHSGIRPDVMTLAKALGNGVPIGACLASGPAAGLFQPGNHATTFGGNPLACAAALAVLDVMEQEALPTRAAILGTRLQDGLRQALADVPGVTAVRGLGLMVGVQLDRPCAALVGRALERGLLLNVTADKVVRLLPPLVLTDAQVDAMVSGVAALVRDFLAEPAP
jgi:acetylornithine aminotransferase